MALGQMAIGEVALLPLIVGLIQFAKLFAPRAPGNLWRAVAFGLGVLGQWVVYLIGRGGSGAGWDLEAYALLVVTGLVAGLAAGKLYDEGAERGLL